MVNAAGSTAPRHTGSVSVPVQGPRRLAVEPCQSLCSWGAAPYRLLDRDGRVSDVFACAGCGSEWVPGEAWTPVDADGVVPAVVVAARRRGATNGPGADEAGTGGR
jgi:hypothetical protein